MSETPYESPVEDVVEQHTEIVPDDDGPDENGRPRTRGWDNARWEADPADAQEQDAEVPIDEDEWR
jgi:hypothetical protein